MHTPNMKFKPCSSIASLQLDIENASPIKSIHTVVSKVETAQNTDDQGKPRLILIRGLPGSGKSTLAEKFVRSGYRHFEADHYFVKCLSHR